MKSLEGEMCTLKDLLSHERESSERLQKEVGRGGVGGGGWLLWVDEKMCVLGSCMKNKECDGEDRVVVIRHSGLHMRFGGGGGGGG